MSRRFRSACNLTNEKDFSHKATMDFVNNQLDQATATLLLRGIFPNPKPSNGPRVFAPNMFVHASAMPTSGSYPALLGDPGGRGDGSGPEVPFRRGRGQQGRPPRREIGLAPGRTPGRHRRPRAGRAASSSRASKRMQQGHGQSHARAHAADADAGVLPAPCAESARPTPQEIEALAMFARFFIDRPIFAWVVSLVILLGGGSGLLLPPHRVVPQHHAPPPCR